MIGTTNTENTFFATFLRLAKEVLSDRAERLVSSFTLAQVKGLYHTVSKISTYCLRP